MTTAYNLETKQIQNTFDCLPEDIVLNKTGESVIFDVYKEELDFKPFFEIFEEIVGEGTKYPIVRIDEQYFRQYILSDKAFVFRLSTTNKTIGGFYIKPKFPGRSSHLACIGMAVKSEYRGQGLGRVMMSRIIKMAKMIGYEAIYNNLIFATNPASIQVCKEHGFVEVGRLPRAAYLEGFGYTDAVQLYRDLRFD